MEENIKWKRGQIILFLALTVVLWLLLPVTGQAQPTGKVQEGLRFSSQILSQEIRYTIYLPPDYETSNRRYPVVYLLHGYTDSDLAWVQFGQVNLIADIAISSGSFHR